MQYVVHNPDGSIFQINKVFDQPNYGKQLDDLGYKYVQQDKPGLLKIDDWHVASGVVTARVDMPITLDKTLVKAGGSDSAVFRGIPKGAKAVITTSGIELYNMAMQDDELEISIPVPCLYTIAFDLFPYKPATFTIEAQS